MNILERLWQRGVLTAIAAALCFCYLLDCSWLKWGDLIVDTGREMYIPMQLLSGKLLYRDIFYPYGPFSPYANAFLFKVFGAHIHSLIISGSLTALLASVLLYKLCRVYLGAGFSTLAVLTFLFVFAFGQYTPFANYNFILPYSYPAIHAIVFALAALYFFHRALAEGRPQLYRYWAAAAAVFLCRLEVGLLLTASVAIYALSDGLWLRRPLRQIVRRLAGWALAPLLLAAACYALFWLSSHDVLLKSNLRDVLRSNLNVSSPFTRFFSGFSDVRNNLVLMVKITAIYGVFFGCFGLAGKISGALEIPPGRRNMALLFLAALATAAGLIAVFLRNACYFPWQYRCLPVFCIITFLLSVSSRPLLAVTAIFSLLLMGRNLLFVWAGHYGFWLLVPGLVVYHVLLFDLAGRAWAAPAARRLIAAGFVALSAVLSAQHWLYSRSVYMQKQYAIRSERGTLYTFDGDREIVCRDFIDFVRTDTPPGATLAVFPEGLMLNVLSGRDNPLYYYSYLPIELANPRVSRDIIADMDRKKIDFVALAQRDTAEYGPAFFGIDYGQEIWSYISKNYVPYQQFGPFPFTTRQFGIALFARRQDGQTSR